MSAISAPADATRVMLVTHTGEVGGAEAALLRLVEMIDSDRFRLSAVLFSDGVLRTALESRGVPTEVLDGGRVARVTRGRAGSAAASAGNVLGAARLAMRLRRTLSLSDADLIVANSLKAAVLCWLAVPWTGRRWIWHLHDRLEADYLPKPAVVLMRLVARTGPTRIIANSQATARTTHRPGVTSIAFPGVPSALFNEPRSAPESFTVGIVGRISATKGQRQFLEAVERLAGRVEAVTFRIVGAALFDDAAEEAAVRALAESSPTTRGVEWTGWTDDPIAEIRRLGLMVHASPVPEPFGQVVVEAMAVGTPVIATDAGGVPEIVDPEGTGLPISDGVTRGAFGILVRPGDARALARAIEWAVTHTEEVTAMAERAREQARRRFSLEESRDRVQNIWRKG